MMVVVFKKSKFECEIFQILPGRCHVKEHGTIPVYK
jgi:hypothetical protein